MKEQHSDLKDPLAGAGVYLWIWMTIGMLCLGVTPWMLMMNGPGGELPAIPLLVAGVALLPLAFLHAGYFAYLVVRHLSGLIEFSSFGAAVHRFMFWLTAVLQAAYLGGLIVCAAMYGRSL